MLNDRNLRCNLNNQIFKKFADKLYVYLKQTNTKGSNYDPYRNTGYTESLSAPIIVKGIVRQVSPESKLAKEIGHFISGTIQFICNEKDVSLIKNAEKIEYKDVEYSVYNKALGNRVQITDTGFGFYTIVLFRKGA